MGTYTVDEAVIDLRVARASRAMCPPGPLMDRFLRDLEDAGSLGPGTLWVASIATSRSATTSICELTAPELCQLQTHLSRPNHVLHADPLQRPVDVLHASEEIRRRDAHLGQARAVGATPGWGGGWLDSQATAGLPRQLDRTHVVFQPVAHVAVLRRDRAGDAAARL